MKSLLKFLLACFILTFSLNAFSQDNSPWKEFGAKNFSGVYMNTGCHEYSLTGGQGFNVYLKNTGIQSVNVTGTVVAKTVCGNDVTSQFNVNLAPGQISNGSDFSQNGNGQTSVVKPEDCRGIKYAKLPYSKFINRIKSVSVANVHVTPLNDSTFIALPAGSTNIVNTNINPSVSSATSSVKQIVTEKVNAAIPTPTLPKIKFDSLGYYKQLLNHQQDSLSTLLSSLKSQNLSLTDSFNSVKLNSLKAATQNTITGTIAPLSLPEVPNTTFSFQAGIGWDKLPLIINQDSVAPGKSFTGYTSHPVLQIGGVLGLFNNKSISLALYPFFSYGFNMKSGEQGTHYTYGLKADLFFSLDKTSTLKLLISGGYTGRNGTWNFTGTELQKADYNYGLIHYGLGIRYTESHGKFWLQPGLYYDAPTTTPVYGPTPYMVANIETGLGKKWQIGLSYGKDYFAQGTLKYALVSPANQDYFGLRILHNFRLL